VEIGGEDLGAAMAALNDSGIPTIASGGAASGPLEKGVGRRSFFRSGTFVILVVIVLAFFAQRLVSPADEDGGRTYDQFIDQIERAPETIERVTLEPDESTLEVTERNGDEYTTGYPPSTEQVLVNLLQRQQIETVVEDTNGSSVLSWLFYLLPFALFFGFFVILMRRMRSGDTAAGSLSGNWRPDRLKAVLDAESAEAAEAHVRQGLPSETYRVGRAKSWS
jgi:hypothetical protein